MSNVLALTEDFVSVQDTVVFADRQEVCHESTTVSAVVGRTVHWSLSLVVPAVHVASGCGQWMWPEGVRVHASTVCFIQIYTYCPFPPLGGYTGFIYMYMYCIAFSHYNLEYMYIHACTCTMYININRPFNNYIPVK